MQTRCHVLIYILKTELKIGNFQPLTDINRKPPKRFSKLQCVNYFIIFLICTNIKYSSANICRPYER